MGVVLLNLPGGQSYGGMHCIAAMEGTVICCITVRAKGITQDVFSVFHFKSFDKLVEVTSHINEVHDPTDVICCTLDLHCCDIL